MQSQFWVGKFDLEAMAFKSGQEPSILAFLDAAKGEKWHKEEPPVGGHQPDGEVEQSMWTVQGQVRTLRLGLQSRHM